MNRAPLLATAAALWLWAAPALAAAAAPAAPDEPPAAGSEGWREARSGSGGFSVQMPAPFTDFNRTGGEKDGEAVTINGLEAIVPAAFGTVQTWQAVCVDYLARVPTEDWAFSDATIEHEANGNLRWKRRLSVDGHPALDFAVSDGKRSVRSRVILLGRRVCTTAVNYPLVDPISDADAERFVASFKAH